MSKAIQLNKDASKEDVYRELLPQISSLVQSEDDLIANLANVAAVLHEAFMHLLKIGGKCGPTVGQEVVPAPNANQSQEQGHFCKKK